MLKVSIQIAGTYSSGKKTLLSMLQQQRLNIIQDNFTNVEVNYNLVENTIDLTPSFGIIVLYDTSNLESLVFVKPFVEKIQELRRADPSRFICRALLGTHSNERRTQLTQAVEISRIVGGFWQEIDLIFEQGLQQFCVILQKNVLACARQALESRNAYIEVKSEEELRQSDLEVHGNKNIQMFGRDLEEIDRGVQKIMEVQEDNFEQFAVKRAPLAFVQPINNQHSEQEQTAQQQQIIETKKEPEMKLQMPSNIFESPSYLRSNISKLMSPNTPKKGLTALNPSAGLNLGLNQNSLNQNKTSVLLPKQTISKIKQKYDVNVPQKVFLHQDQWNKILRNPLVRDDIHVLNYQLQKKQVNLYMQKKVQQQSSQQTTQNQLVSNKQQKTTVLKCTLDSESIGQVEFEVNKKEYKINVLQNQNAYEVAKSFVLQNKIDIRQIGAIAKLILQKQESYLMNQQNALSQELSNALKQSAQVRDVAFQIELEVDEQPVNVSIFEGENAQAAAKRISNEYGYDYGNMLEVLAQVIQ